MSCVDHVLNASYTRRRFEEQRKTSEKTCGVLEEAYPDFRPGLLLALEGNSGYTCRRLFDFYYLR